MVDMKVIGLPPAEDKAYTTLRVSRQNSQNHRQGNGANRASRRGLGFAKHAVLPNFVFVGLLFLDL
jgi:hypothetical protein